MNNIEILEEFIEQYIASYPEEKEWVAIYPEQIQAIENLIQENKELKEYQYKVNEIMNFDEENLDTIRVANNYIGLKNCVTQLRKQIEKLEGSQCVYKDTSSCNKVLSFETYTKLKDYIPKSKVKEKIKEYNIPIFDILDKLPIPRTIEEGCGAKDGIIYVLQELLEEGE